MSEFKKGDIIVSLKEQGSSDRTNPFIVREGYIGENLSPTDPKIVWFKDTPPAKGSYKAKNFREATSDEKSQYIKGRSIIEPESLFEEGDIVTTLKIVNTIDMKKGTYPLAKDIVLQIDGIVKNVDPNKSIMYFIDTDGYYHPNDESFRLATQEEIDKYNGIL